MGFSRSRLRLGDQGLEISDQGPGPPDAIDPSVWRGVDLGDLESAMPEGQTFRRRAIGALLMGFVGLLPLLATPRLHRLYAVDMVALIGCGMCFGVSLVLFIFAFRAKGA